MQDPNRLLAILGKMAQKSEVTFDDLFPKLYNVELWLLAYQSIAPKQGNMTPGVDRKTIDGAGVKLITDIITELKTARYVPKPTRRVSIPKPNGKMRPLGIPSFRDKLLQTVVKLILEAIYEPIFADTSHGFRPNRSCHTALEYIKSEGTGVRWWVEGDIKGFFDNVNHDTLLRILGKRITDKRFLHLIGQFLKAGYVEDWKYHQTYTGTPQGGNLSPILSNIYLNELDQAIAMKVAEYNKGKERKRSAEYHCVSVTMSTAKKKARCTGDWARYKALKKRSLRIPSVDHQDPDYRRLVYVRYADDFLVGVIGPKADAGELKLWLEAYLRDELQLELSVDKTLITNAKERVRFLGYDIARWSGERIYRFQTKRGPVTRRTGCYQLKLYMPRDKTINFAKEYGNTTTWYGLQRNHMLNLSELEILLTYNAEIRGFLGYYALADNLKREAQKVLWLTQSSFFRTLAAKRKCTLKEVARSLKRGPGRYVITLQKDGQPIKEYELLTSTKHLKQGDITYDHPDLKPTTIKYRSRTELGQRLLAHECEWCGTQEGTIEVHHVRKLGSLKGKTLWERQMIQRRRKTMVLCSLCHDDLHAGRLSERTRKPRENRRAGYIERYTSGSEGEAVKPVIAI